MNPVRLTDYPPTTPLSTFDKHAEETVSPSPITPSSPSEKRHGGFFTEVVKFAAISLAVVIPFRMFIAQPFIVSGASMSPTFETGQYLIIDQVSYRFEEPLRGDVVIFRFPEDPSKFFIKRIIGLPGETIEIRGSDVMVKSASGEQVRLNEPYLASANLREDFLTITLSGEEYFVLGDNRAASSDSRVWGAVPRKNIVGKAFARLLPIAEASFYPGTYHLENPVAGTR